MFQHLTSNSRYLLCIRNTSSFTNNCNLNLSRISHFVLNLCSNFTTQSFSLFIIHLISTYDNPEFTTSLNSISLRHSGITHGYCLQIIQALDICFYDFPTCTRTSTTNSITNLNDWSKQSVHVHFIMMCTYRITNIWFLLIFFSNLSSI